MMVIIGLSWLALMLILSLYHGVNEAVDDAAHLSGLAIGFLLALLLLRRKRSLSDP